LDISIFRQFRQYNQDRKGIFRGEGKREQKRVRKEVKTKEGNRTEPLCDPIFHNMMCSVQLRPGWVNFVYSVYAVRVYPQATKLGRFKTRDSAGQGLPGYFSAL